jgi:NitT/TauT family transport system substrate-binding protein
MIPASSVALAATKNIDCVHDGIAAKIAEFEQGRAMARQFFQAIAGAVLLLGTVWSEAGAQAPRKVTIVHGSQQIEVTHPGLYLGDVLGYNAAEGLEVTVQTSQGSQQALQLLAAGRADFVQVTTETIINARDQGVSARIIYSAVNHYNSQIAALADGPIKDVKDFKGKQIGVFSLSSGSVPYLKAVLKEAGLDPDKDVTMVPTGAGAPALQALNSGTVSALSLWAGAFAVYENQGARLKLFTSRDLSTAPGHVLATTDEFIKQNPDVAAKVGRIYAKSAVFAFANPQAAVQAYWKALPQNKPPEVSDKTLAEQQHILSVGLRDMRVEDRPDKRWGWNDPEGLAKLQDYLIANGVRKSVVPTEQLATNDLVDQYNAFDAAAVKAAASIYKP